ncbi:precorrin-3B synthase [Jidongwangia harbinensis]|uniref:precorrin-3B synthase n=1 Tax=Jidongwangia harbinensis TaxID=2878561 RepID=UPI001CD9ABD3|nr:precorrin-3B synthase [Jidongwangia harbinensis]MCA2216524.1 precorrin-3B synthase [Jidongwangia harbinensis]
MPTPESRRSDVDACPGALRLHAAADGPLARVRLPGGLLTGAQAGALRTLAERWGDGHLEFTSRGNVQLRALTGAPAAALTAALAGAGLLPSETHETVRNIAASPLPAAPDVRPVVRALDAALCDDRRLAGLPGRFLFAVDSGALDVATTADVTAVPGPALSPATTADAAAVPGPALSPATTADAAAVPGPALSPATTADVTAVPGPALSPATTADVTAVPGPALSPATAADVAAVPRPALSPGAGPTSPADPFGFAVVFGGFDLGLRVPADRLVAALIAAAHAFLDERAAQQRPAWRIGELDDGPARVAARTAAALGRPLGPAAGRLAPPRVREPIGVLAQPGGLAAAGASVPLGRLGGVPLEVLASADHLVVTPWRGIVVPDLPPPAARSWLSALGEAGLVVTAGSRWSGVSACAGRPGCAKSLADVRADAGAATTPGTGLPVHWVGCARGCGSPSGPHVRVEATGSGYRVTAPGLVADAPAGEVGGLVAAARRS